MLVKKKEKRSSSKLLIEIIQKIDKKKEIIEITINVIYMTK